MGDRSAPGARTRSGVGRFTRVFGIVVCALVILASLGLYGTYHRLDGGISREEVDESVLGPRPVKQGESVNVLIIGSDERSGENAQYGRADGARANIMVLAHIPPDRDGATLVSFPRDSYVRMPECEPWEDFPGSLEQTGPLNHSLNHGGPPCVWRSIEQLTDIHIDHFVKMDMVGFREIVDSVGGVPLCLPEPMADRRAQLDLPAGEQVLNGEDSLAFVRARYEVGEGTDLGRVQRQQMFMGALMQKILSQEVLASPPTTLELLEATTGHLVMDDQLTLDVMTGLAYSLRHLRPEDIGFHTVPWRYSEAHQGRVEWIEDEARELFSAVAAATSTGAAEGEPAGEEDAAEESGSRPPEPEDIEVRVLNATGIDGLAAEVGRILEERGFTVIERGDTQAAQTAVRGGDADQEAAQVVADQVEDPEGAVPTETAPGGEPGTVELVLGPDWRGMAPDPGEAAEVDPRITAEVDPCTDGMEVDE